ncbi:hypothetical protein SPBR_01186 [Sporothrix brasiliensis 5110]|uniref:Uncharacterized protein n=1 Tax=Sporothrix brasiliensis 5110 TaxID=1398154 RepID=A0A0C2J2U3_9PEZI|nr:uncharacterized protein SPBR_01186 [Sporothrix brasiliensis 5110]KIH91397.1 hypothetical protein SPBR_01186 [Sporothrix brasiliensis 5110]
MSSQPPTASSVNPSAATAAVSAYNLSSAAAAAALRALPAAPTNVGAVQTKRTMRRSASVSSEGSRRALSPVPSIKRAMGIGGGNKDTREALVISPTGAPTVRRRGSSSSIKSMSSMTERTFRSPSPHNPRTAALAAATPASPSGSVNSNRSLSMNAAGTAAAMAARSRSAPAPPPMPTIPKHVIDNQVKQQMSKPQKEQQAEKKNRRATSLGLVQQPLQLASQKQQGARASWFGSATVGKKSDIRTSDTAMDINGYAQPERPGSRSSLQNFSYPSRQRLGSPPPSPTHTRSTATPAAAPVALPLAGKLPRSASTERGSSQPQSSQQKTATGSARRSASTSRVTGRSNLGLSDQTLVYDANSRRMVPRGELLMLEQSILDAAERPLQQQRKKKQQRGTAAASLAGSHLSQGTMTQAHGTAAPLNRAELQRIQEPAPQQTVPVQAPQAPKSPPPERELPPIATTALEPPAAPQPTASERDTDDAGGQPLPALSTSASTPSSSASSLTALAASQAATSPVTIQSMSSPEDGSFDGTLLTEDGRPVLAKRPSIVREEPDREEEAETQHRTSAQTSQPQLATAAAVLAAAGSSSARDGLDGVPAKLLPHHDSNAEAQQEHATAQSAAAKPGEAERTRSNSPVRTAHFSPIVSTNLAVRRHSPPPRSISPRKSALKHSSSPRDASPSDSASDANNAHPGDLQMPAQNRKKANRVSFDDKAVVVTQSPMPPSPPVSPALSSLPGAAEAPPNSNAAHQPPSRSRSWFGNIGRNKKKLDHAANGDDVVMKPRPALPSFGSVRDKPQPSQYQEERALVRPINDNQSPHRAAQTPPPTTSTAAATAAPLETHHTSSDHAIGFIIGAGAAAAAGAAAGAAADRPTSASTSTRNTANTSRYREPLPPVVTSVDGSGYVSDSGASSDGDVEDVDEEHSPVLRFDEEQDTTVPGNLEDEPIIPPSPVANDADPIVVVPSVSSPTQKTVPAISISHPSQESLTAVRGTEDDDGDDEEKKEGEKEVDTEDEIAKEDETATAVTPGTEATQPAVKNSPAHAPFDVPGMFPTDTDSDGTAKSSPTKATFAANNSPVPIRQNAFEPITQEDDHSYSAQMPATVFATHMPTLHEETSLRSEKVNDDDSDSEVFSDAYEDLSDIEGDGFLSLDAVVDSPIVPDMVKSPFAASALAGSPSRKPEVLQLGPSPLAKETAPSALTGDSPSAGPTDPTASSSPTAVDAGGAAISMAALTSAAIHKHGNSDGFIGSGDEEDWEKIKAFWRGLTTEKRAQLEKEALQDAADEGDLEDESAAEKKPRRKKSVETRLAEKKAIQELTPVQKPKADPAPAESQPQKAAATRIRRSMRDNAPRATTAAASAATAGSAAGADKEHFKSSLRPNPPAQKERAASAFPPKAAVGAVTQPRALATTLRRRGSDSSESSFKRVRSDSHGASIGGFGAGAAAGAAGAAGFRMSMRSDPKGAAPSNNGLNNRSSRFSLRSLSPTGSTTLRGSTESSPQFRRSMRDGSLGSGFTPVDMKRMSSPGSMASSTLRRGSADSGGGFFSSFGKKRGSKLLQRSKNQGGGSGSKSARSRFGDSSDDDDDIFGPTTTASSGGLAAHRRSVSTGGAYTFRSRFVDSSDEDEAVLDRHPVGRKDKDHVVPKTLRTGSSMRSASARPASSSMPLSPLQPEELEEEEGELEARPKTAPNGLPSYGFEGGTSSLAGNAANNNLGTSTLRRSRSGRGQIAPVSPMYSPTTTGTVGLNTDSNVTPTRRSSGIMSVLRRKKNNGPSSPGSFTNGGSANKIQRAGLVDSAARRDTQLERSTAELAAVRSNSIGSQNRRILNGGASGGSTPRFVPQNDDSDDDDLGDSEDSPGAARRAGAPASASRSDSWPFPGPNGHDVDISAIDFSEKRKKKFSSLRRMFRLDD